MKILRVMRIQGPLDVPQEMPLLPPLLNLLLGSDATSGVTVSAGILVPSLCETEVATLEGGVPALGHGT